MSADELPSVEKGRIFMAQDIHDRIDWQARAIKPLTEQVYVTIDLDAFDPSLVPSTGTPEPGGLLVPDARIFKAGQPRKTDRGF